jgi:HAD superfamily hydrolase (TIGR01509 family)
MVEAIIFGLWETLGTKYFSASKILREHFSIKETQEFLHQYEMSLHLRKWDDKEEMAKSFLKAFGLLVTEANIRFVIDTILKGVKTATMFEGMEKVLRELKKQFKLAILSNTTNFEAEVITKWNIQNLFDEEIYPWKISSLKPSKKSFEEVCKQLSVKPDGCIFVDNENRSIEAAKRMWLKTIKFQNVETMKKELADLGIKV